MKRTPASKHQRAGVAALSDLESGEWSDILTTLEADQELFLANENKFRSPEYKWPRDPLHTWSRVWEYPYAYSNIRQELSRINATGGKPPTVVDFGSGVTFFPLSISTLGCTVCCVDTDPIVANDMQRAIKVCCTSKQSVDVKLLKGSRLPFGDAQIDGVYSVSVLEHIPNPTNTIEEIARVLKPEGFFLVTLDLDNRGDSEIGVKGFAKLYEKLTEKFESVYSEQTVHPLDVLTSLRGPYKLKPISALRRWALSPIKCLKNLVYKGTLRPQPLYELTVYGALFRKKGDKCTAGPLPKNINE